MQAETNIVKIVESRRYFQTALKFLLSKKNRKLMKERSRYITVDPDVSSNCDPENEQELSKQERASYSKNEASAVEIVTEAASKIVTFEKDAALQSYLFDNTQIEGDHL